MAADTVTPAKSGARFDSATLYGIITCGVVLAFVVWAFHFFGRLFPLIEYRDWSDPGNARAIFQLFSIHGIEFSRSVGMFVDASIGAVFGRNVAMHNACQILLLGAAAALLVMGLRRLLPTAAQAFMPLAVAFMLFSTPVLDSLTWQATMLDKLCLFFAALATFLVARLSLDDLPLQKVLAMNAVCFVVAVAAYNSKESDFGLVPSLLLLVVARSAPDLSAAQAVQGLKKGLSLLAAPLLYAAVHIAIVAHYVAVTPAAQLHDTNGSLPFNVYHFAVYLFNLEGLAGALHIWPYLPMPGLVAFTMAAIVMIVLATLALILFAPRTYLGVWLWAVASFVMSFAIYAHATGIPEYYMLVPGFYLTICLFTFFAAFAQRARLVANVVAPALMACYITGFAALSPIYLRTTELSDNFTQALAQVKAVLAEDKRLPNHIALLWPKAGDWKTYMFMGPANHHGLAPYLSDSTSPQFLAQLDSRISDASYDSTTLPHPHTNELVVVFGDQLQLERVIDGNK